MNSTDHSDNGNGTDLQSNLNAEQALDGVLRLIRDHKQVSDFTPERLNQAFQTTVQFANDGSGRYGFGESISPEWSYNFDVNNKVKDLKGKEWSQFNFSFNSNIPGAYPDISSICTMSFDKFTAELESMGFKRQRYYGEHGRWIYDEFNNATMRVQVYLEGEAEITANKAANACVKMIEIS